MSRWVYALGVLAVLVGIALAWMTWAPERYKHFVNGYYPASQICYGISVTNPAAKEDCYYKKSAPCNFGLTGTPPKLCYGLLRNRAH